MTAYDSLYIETLYPNPICRQPNPSKKSVQKCIGLRKKIIPRCTHNAESICGILKFEYLCDRDFAKNLNPTKVPTIEWLQRNIFLKKKAEVQNLLRLSL